MVALAAAILPEPPGGKFTLAWRLAGTGFLLLVLPAASAISALADATAALYFPAWVRPGQAPAQGPEAMGYGIVLMLGKGALLLAGLLLPAIPGAILVAAVAAWGQAALLPSAVLIAGLVVATGVAVEIYLVSEVLGRRFEKLDAAEEGILS